MRIRRRDSTGKPHGRQMTAMIDVVFLLLIFFMLTLKVVEPEGDFNIRMPSAGTTPQKRDATLDVNVRLLSNGDGTLEQIRLGQRNLGGGPAAFERLNLEMRKLARGGLVEEVTIDADYRLNYDQVVQAISACRGRRDAGSGRLVKYFDHIRFAPPRRPAGSA